MKKIPYEPNSPNKGMMQVESIDISGEKGVLCHMVAHPTTWEGFPWKEVVRQMDLSKDFFSSTLLYGLGWPTKLIAGVLFLIYLINRRLLWWIVFPYVEMVIQATMDSVYRYRLKGNRYTRPVREIRRVADTFIDEMEPIAKGGSPIWNKVLAWKARDWICLFFEFDNSYRFRGQDVATDLDKIAFIKDPFKEIERLVDLLIKREKNMEEEHGPRGKWVQLKKVVKLLRFIPGLKKIILDIFNRVDWEQIKFNENDIYWIKFRRPDEYRYESVIDYSEYDKDPEKFKILSGFVDTASVLQKGTQEANMEEDKPKNIQEAVVEDKTWHTQKVAD
jgi:hypothetical protein